VSNHPLTCGGDAVHVDESRRCVGLESIWAEAPDHIPLSRLVGHDKGHLSRGGRVDDEIAITEVFTGTRTFGRRVQ
jgi:hypothetical protein